MSRSPHACIIACTIFTVACISWNVAQAAVLAEFTFPASSSFASSDTDPNSSSSDFIFSGMGTSSSQRGRSVATAPPNLNTIFTRGSVLGTTEAGAVSSADYYSFTLTPSGGFMASLTELTFQTDSTFGPTVDYSTTVFVRSSIDGFTSNLTLFTDGPGTSGTVYNDRSISLSGSEFQNVTAPIEFRIYLFMTGPDAGSNDAIFRSDTYVLNGVISAIPEPSIPALLALGAVGLGFLRRREYSVS